MSGLLQKTRFTVNDELDFVNIRFGVIHARIGYRVGFHIDHYLRLAAKQAARVDRANAKFWHDMELPDLNDCPKTNRQPRQSMLTPTVVNYAVNVNPPLVSLEFDGKAMEMDYETAIKLGHEVRRASRRAKAWAGDGAKYSAMLGMLTDAESDYRLGLT